MFSDDSGDDIIFYCQRCWSNNIKRGKKIPNTDCTDLYCGDCGAGPKHLDVTTYDRWCELYQQHKGVEPFQPEPSIYDDLIDEYNQMSIDTMTAEEALSNGLNVGEYINRKIKD